MNWALVFAAGFGAGFLFLGLLLRWHDAREQAFINYVYGDKPEGA